MDIYHLDGVVVIEMQNVMVPTNDIASKATRAMPSESMPLAHTRRLHGSGVVIAVLDTGVDNEHRSSDFDDKTMRILLLSYDDHKWVQVDNIAHLNRMEHRTPMTAKVWYHVAGSALGTGDSSRVHTGTALAHLGRYQGVNRCRWYELTVLVNGMQWMINNAETDWGHPTTRESVGSMSFGSLSSPHNPGDEGDNGTVVRLD